MTKIKIVDGVDINDFKQKLKENKGTCICSRDYDNPDMKCMCKPFKEQKEGVCRCGIYEKVIVEEKQCMDESCTCSPETCKCKKRITVYTLPTCVKCKILKKKLDAKGIIYNEIDDIPTLTSKGYLEFPVLEVGSDVFDFDKALEWLANEK